MRSAASRSRITLDRSARDVETERRLSAGRWRVGRAYRGGRLVCGCVYVAIRVDERVGLTQLERRLVQVRFHEPVDDDLRSELAELVRRRGTACDRTAERIDPIELVVDDPYGEHERIIGGLRPPQRRHGQVREIEFGLREVAWT
jgi:hypothetical protein